jgi:hypothetical protein
VLTSIMTLGVTMKARDWLVSKGLAKEGRGKFSNAARDALDKAVSEGMSFSDYPKGVTGRKPARKVTARKRAVASKQVNSEERTLEGMAEYTFPSDFRYPEASYVAKAGSKVYSVREVCNTCRVSLTNHICLSPTILGGISVQIVER